MSTTRNDLSVEHIRVKAQRALERSVSRAQGVYVQENGNIVRTMMGDVNQAPEARAALYYIRSNCSDNDYTSAVPLLPSRVL